MTSRAHIDIHLALHGLRGSADLSVRKRVQYEGRERHYGFTPPKTIKAPGRGRFSALHKRLDLLLPGKALLVGDDAAHVTYVFNTFHAAGLKKFTRRTVGNSQLIRRVK